LQAVAVGNVDSCSDAKIVVTIQAQSGPPSTFNPHASCNCFCHLQTLIISQPCTDLPAISPRICVSRRYRHQTRKHPPCSSASTRNVPSSRTSNNCANSVPALLVRWSNWRRSYPPSRMVLRVRRLVKIQLPVLTSAAIATVLSNWHTVLRAIHMASGMHCSSLSHCLSLLTLMQPTSPNLNKKPDPNPKPIFLYPKPSSEYPCNMSTSPRPLTRTMPMTRPSNEHVPTLGSF
jgi:hypothetical protein